MLLRLTRNEIRFDGEPRINVHDTYRGKSYYKLVIFDPSDFSILRAHVEDRKIVG